jgi:hypothetical protein
MGATQRFEVLALAAGAVSLPLAGTMFEFVGKRPRAIRLWAVQDNLAGANAVITVNYGTITAVEDGTVIARLIAANNGSGPDRQDHELTAFLASPMDRIKVLVRNSGGTAFSATTGFRILLEHQDL